MIHTTGYRYTVMVRDDYNNTTVMSEHFTLDDAKEEEAVLRIEHPLMHIWIESESYKDE